MEQRPTFESKFLVGIEQVDQEHRQLFEIAARVYDVLAEAGATGAVQTAIAELLDYTNTHFSHEETLMAEAGYPELEAHRKLHRHLLSRARDMEMRAELEEQYVALELNRFLYNWLVDHILEEDRKFGGFMVARD